MKQNTKIRRFLAKDYTRDKHGRKLTPRQLAMRLSQYGIGDGEVSDIGIWPAYVTIPANNATGIEVVILYSRDHADSLGFKWVGR